MDLIVNGEKVTTLHTQSRNWDVPATVSVNVPLHKGRNSICLSNDISWMPDIDKMEVE
jgi:hypothetical protein